MIGDIKMNKIFCIGHAVYDTTLPIESYPLENSKIKTNDKIEGGGGSASNCAVLLAKWGEKAYFIGTVGNDIYGKRIRKDFIKNNVNVRYLRTSSKINTSTSYILASKNNGKRTIITYKDINLKSPTNSIISKAKIILLDGNEYELASKILDNNKKAVTIIDGGSAQKETIELAKKVKYLVCSKDFAEGYTNLKIEVKDINSIIKVYQILENDFKNIVVITLEEHGSFSKINNEYKLIPSIKVKVVDSTGAGDIYHGSFTYFISNGYSLEKTMKLSNIAGALSVTKLGSRNSIPTIEEVLNYDR